ncbi:MAG: hypothetical protein KTV72_03695, partial [Wolbachia endosymbiont of Melophagus ovinus]|nr:hypothetical protein [Wolbachia endosymbiont of Melophagus ovinus]
MSNLSENFKNSYENFKQYAHNGTVPTVTENNSEVPQNCFYKSVHYIDNVVGPVKDMLVGVNKGADASTTLGNRKEAIKGRAHNASSYVFANSLLVLYTGAAYIAYLPHKL